MIFNSQELPCKVSSLDKESSMTNSELSKINFCRKTMRQRHENGLRRIS